MKNILVALLVLLSIDFYAQELLYSQSRIILGLKKDIQKTVINLNELEELNFLFDENTVLEVKKLNISSSKTLNGNPLVVVFETDVNIESLIKTLKETSLFDYVEPDYISHGSGIKQSENVDLTESFVPLSTTPNDQFFFRQWGLNNNGTFSLSPSVLDADVDMIEAWDITTGSPTIVMAVLDSGIKMDHPEFNGRFWFNTLEQSNGFDDDENGYIDDFSGWDFVNNDNDPTDDHGHGTNVTGIAVANANNNIGYAGVDWNCKLLPLKVLNENNSGFTSNIISSIYYAVNRGVDVISISIGGSGYSLAYENAVNFAYDQNIPVIACMMNFNNNVSYYPAAFPNAIAVGSTNPNDYRSAPFFWSATSGSNYGNHIDVVAPGNYIYGLSHTSNTSYGSYWGGTSQATPLVSGVVSLMLSINPNLTVTEIRTILRNTAQDQVGNPSEDTLGWDQYYGAGRVNAFNVLSYLQNLSTTSFNSNSEINLYPNPTNDFLYLHSNVDELYSILIYDISGRFIKSLENIKTMIDVTELESGVYFLELGFNDKKIVKKIVKK
ncbi:S8 family serine peptidase [Flavobacterium lacus]|uniref:Putative secreted protein (Por secretion system target) n=1 Tax=Flavobacterium lacus TaxID=1353778 RepID=A0A328WYU1_9FLAO|nr:S8 family serine peptidase [Flavobacterium lacus]RAR49617.1 putative secreted protein (Por secretion system target) [Flavobacterium lacus]